MTPKPLPTVARTVGRYHLLDALASGGMGAVYLARAVGTGGFERVVAVKLCHPHLREDPHFVAMFLDEARLAARIHHPNVVATLDVGDDADALYLVMEYVEGGRLLDLLYAAGAGLPPAIAARVMLDALAGLHAAHELRDAEGRSLSLVHRDVSPQNVLVGVDGVARLADFGVAKAEARAATTRDGEVKGKLGYMAPEQLLDGTATRRTDVYAAGVVLWETLAGARLFAGVSERDVLASVLRGGAPALATLSPSVPGALDDVVRRAMDRDPAQRFATAAEFAAALERAVVPASAREVGEHVGRALEPALERRRAALRARGSEPIARVPTTAPARIDTGVTATDAARIVAPPRPARGTAWMRLAGGAIALAAASAALGFALRGRGDPAHDAARPARTNPVVALAAHAPAVIAAANAPAVIAAPVALAAPVLAIAPHATPPAPVAVAFPHATHPGAGRPHTHHATTATYAPMEP